MSNEGQSPLPLKHLVMIVRWALLLPSMSCGSDPTGTGDGVVLWSVPAGSSAEMPLITDELVVFGGLNGVVTGFDRETGDTAWSANVGGEVWGQPKRHGSTVIVPHGLVWALSLVNGAVLWSYGGPGNTAGTTDVAVAGDTVFVGSAGGWTAALDANTGDELWLADLEEAAFAPTVSDDLVFYGTRGFLGDEPREGPLGAGHVVAVNREDGSEAWRLALPDAPGFPNSGGAVNGGAVAGDLLIVGAIPGTAYGLRLPDGSIAWQQENDGMPNHAQHLVVPGILENVAVFLRDDHVVEGREVNTGELLWSLEQPVSTDPVIVRGDLGYLFSGPILVFNEDGQSVWSHGGLDETGGTSFFNADVDPDGMIYSLGIGAGNNATTRVFALSPPIRP